MGWFLTKFQHGVEKAWLVLVNLQHSFHKQDVHLPNKGRVYFIAVGSSLLYSCETCTLKIKDIRKLSEFDHRSFKTWMYVEIKEWVSVWVRRREPGKDDIFSGNEAVGTTNIADITTMVLIFIISSSCEYIMSKFRRTYIYPNIYVTFI